MAFPTDSGDPKLCGGIWGFGIFDNGDEAKIEAARTFIDFIAADPDQVKDSVLASTYFPVRTSVGDIYADNEIMSEYSKFMAYLGDYYQITPGWATARTEWWNMLQRVGSGEDVETASDLCGQRKRCRTGIAHPLCRGQIIIDASPLPRRSRRGRGFICKKKIITERNGDSLGCKNGDQRA